MRSGEVVPTDRDADDFAAWVEPHLLAMSRLAARLAGPTERDDVVQDALVRAWQRRGTYRTDRGTPLVWLLAIVADRARRHRTRAPREVPVELAVPATPERQRDLDLELALRHLPPRERLAVALFYFVDLDVAGIAQVMGCSVGTVKATLHHAREHLRGHLGGAR